MTHDEATNAIVDRFLGRADGPTRAGVDAHAAGCDECRGALETLRVIVKAGAAPAHPESDRIVEIARGGAIPTDGERRHLEACAACAAEIEAVRGSIAGARAGRERRFVLPASLAAALVVAILGYPAYLGIVGRPRPEAAAPAGTQAPGSVGVALYLDAARAASDAPVLEIAPGASLVTLLIEPSVVDPVGEAERVRLEIRGGGGVAWSREASPADLRGAGSDRLIALLVPAASLRPGPATLSVVRISGDGETSLLAAPFTIAQRQSP